MAARARSRPARRALTAGTAAAGSPRGAPGTVALERALSKLGIASRREARGLILEGRVTVDGRAIRDPLRGVVPERARIAIDGEARPRAVRRTIVLHKPRGVVTTRRDPEGRPTAYDLVRDAGHGLQAVGRLDLASSGLLLFTTDTRLAAALTDPARGVPRVYAVTVRGSVDEDALAALRRGVRIDGELALPREVTIRKRSSRETHLMVTLDEGRNREIRRLFAAAGHEVTRLLRVSFGPIALGPLQPGRWRALTPDESRALAEAAATG
jgi:23S rRNA pseudouridine2605 synthase